MVENFRVVARYLISNWYYSLLNIIGFSSGVTVSLLLFFFCFHEMSFDRFHKNEASIYLLRMDYLSNGSVIFGMYPPAPVYDILKHDYSEVNHACRVYFENGFLKSGSDIYKTNKILRVDSDFFNLFDFKTISGSTNSIFTNPNSVLITENIAKLYFKDANPIGQSVKFSNQKEFTISGILESPPSNSSLQFDFITSTSAADSVVWKFIEVPPTYFEIKDVNQVTRVTNGLQKKLDEVYGAGVYRLESVPLGEQYIHEGLLFLLHGNRMYISLFLSIALLILLISVVNYANLSTAQIIKRSKEIAVRKIIGASRLRLLSRHILELSILLLTSFGIALISVYILLPSFNEMLGRQISLQSFHASQMVLFCIVLFISSLALASIYPLWQLSNLSPVRALKNGVNFNKRGVFFRKGLTIVQFTISMVLITCTLIIQGQVHFLITQRLGFDKEQILSLKVNPQNQEASQNYSTLKNELLQLNGVKGVTVSPMPEYDFEMDGAYTEDGKQQSTKAYIFKVDDDFFSVMNIRLLEGHTFDKANPKEGIVINQTAANLFFEGDPIGKENKMLSKKKVIGVVEDFHYAGMRNRIYPLVLDHFNKSFKSIQIKFTTEGVQAAITDIKKIWKKYFPDQVYEYRFLSEEYQNLYESETRIANGFTIFSATSIVIACLGLIGLASYVIKNKRKEISVRVVFGASVNDILQLLLWYFLLPVLLSILLSIPIVYWSMSNYLNNFVYRIQIEPWQFIAGALMTIILVVVSIGLLCFRSARVNPIVDIRNE